MLYNMYTDLWANPLTWIILICGHIISWCAIIHALTYKSDPRSALGWCIACLFLPYIGALLYFIFGIGRAQSRAAYLMRNTAITNPIDILHGGESWQMPPGSISPKNLPPHYLAQAQIGRTLTNRYIADGNNISPLFGGAEAYPAMLNAINNAKKRVFLTTYIFKGKRAGKQFFDALTKARDRNVDVRLIIDGLGGLIYSFDKLWFKLKDKGVKVKQFLPLSLIPFNVSINLRNHRKVLICDDIGFTGGMNITDENWLSPEHTSIKDIHFLCEGPIVAQLQEAFLYDWGFITKKYEEIKPLYKQNSGSDLCRMILDGPGSGKDPLHELYCSIITTAKTHVRIITPYFLPTHDLIACLKATALRGVDISIILPAKNNLVYVQWASLRLIPTLMEAGLKIYNQPAPFAHTKLLIIDEYYVQFGSANLDPRSLRLNFELNVETFSPALAQRMIIYFKEIRDTSRQLQLKELQEQHLILKLRNSICWIFSPYL